MAAPFKKNTDAWVNRLLTIREIEEYDVRTRPHLNLCLEEIELEPGWLGILKASGWQLLGLSGALSVFWLLLRREVLPPSDLPVVLYGLPLAMLITAGLGLASLIEQLAKLLKTEFKKHQENRKRKKTTLKHQRKFAEYIPYMNDHELAIYGYLLSHNQKSFAAEMDCGHAASLYKRQFVQSDAQNGLFYGETEFPFSIPDHIWSVLEENRDQFPIEFPEKKLPWFRSRW